MDDKDLNHSAATRWSEVRQLPRFQARATLAKLRAAGAVVVHGVDATALHRADGCLVDDGDAGAGAAPPPTGGGGAAATARRPPPPPDDNDDADDDDVATSRAILARALAARRLSHVVFHHPHLGVEVSRDDDMSAAAAAGAVVRRAARGAARTPVRASAKRLMVAQR